jgi:hypothetical protein
MNVRTAQETHDISAIGPNRYILPIVLWQCHINTIVIILNTPHSSVFRLKHNVSDTRLFICLQAEPAVFPTKYNLFHWTEEQD